MVRRLTRFKTSLALPHKATDAIESLRSRLRRGRDRLPNSAASLSRIVEACILTADADAIREYLEKQ